MKPHRHKEQNWPEIFFYYYIGSPQRLMIKRFTVPDRTIRDRCKMLINRMMQNENSTIRKHWEGIEKDIKEIMNES